MSQANRIEIGISLHRVDDVAASAREFEDLGYDYVSSGEHVSFNVPTSNSFISLAVAAGATTRIRVVNSIALVPLYPAALLAKLGAALDVASGGRFELGVGIGGEIPREFEACGVPVKERGPRTNEALEVIRRLWTEPSVTFEGRFNRLTDVSIAPQPVQRPHPRIWVSGRKEAAMARTARYGDGWLPYMYTPEMLASSVARIAELRAESDRAGDPVRAGLFAFFCVHEDRDTANRMAAERLSKQYAQDFSTLAGRYALVGTPEDVRVRLGEFVDAGARTVIVSSACAADYVDENHRLFANEVLPAFR
ncbi:MAG: LLM class flavin-dependent oxidoreductase [Acidimicrobiia bacterium]|nr:LLM class flavin-dependent oxidoreductase [Acidimicrobiia bacterium]